MDIVKRNRNNENVESTKGDLYRKPDCDIYENDDAYTMYFDLPGVEKEDIEVKVEKDVLTLSADCTKKAGEDYSCLRDEMIYSGFKRSFELGDSVNSNDIRANYKDGTLQLTLPKRDEQKTHKISIAVN